MKIKIAKTLRAVLDASIFVFCIATPVVALAADDSVSLEPEEGYRVAIEAVVSEDADASLDEVARGSEKISILPGGKEDKDYIMQTGDRIKITIYPEDDHIKGAEMEISSEGNITLPLVGKILVNGKKPIEAEREIAEILDRDYLVNPEVVIEVTDKYASEKEKSVVLLGQVKQPGSQPFPKAGRFTLLQAIAVVGGFSDVANIKKIKVIRGGEVQGEVLRVNAEDIISGKRPDIELEDGDIINVAESLF